MNRAAKRARLFDSADDYGMLEELLVKAKVATGMRLLAYCMMPNHWHLILWPTGAAQMSQFMRRFTGTHAQLWQRSRSSTGSGAVYQGRYRAIPVQTGRYFFNACGYVESNALRAGLVSGAQDWRWSSLWRRLHDEDDVLLAPWPVPCPGDWLQRLNAESEPIEEIRAAISRGAPLGDSQWIEETAAVVGLSSRLRSRGRPPKPSAKIHPTPSGENAPDPELSDG